LRRGPQYLFLSKSPGMTPAIALLKSTSNSSQRHISAQRNAVSEARSVGKLSINNCMGPVALAITRKPIQQNEVSQVPNSGYAANRVNAANKSCQNRNPIVSVASARECDFGVRTECL